MQAYFRHFGLNGAPFKFTTSPGTLYFSAEHYEGLAALQWGFRERGGLMLLVGEIGTGKSTLIEWALQQHNDERVRIAVLTNPTFTLEEMLQLVISQLRIHPVAGSAEACLQALKTFLADPAPGDRVILIFDEAQGLSDEALQQLVGLSKLTVAGGQSLQIVLVGQPELEARLDDPGFQALKDRIGFRSRLNPLRPGEVTGYIEHLLSIQGGRQGIFSPEALDEVARLSGGIPRKINTICHNALLLAFSEGATDVDARHVRAAMADFRILEECEAVAPSGAFEADPERGHRRIRMLRPLTMAFGLAIAAAGVALAIGLRPGRFGTLPANVRSLAATVSRLLPKHLDASANDSNDSSDRQPADRRPAAAGSDSAVSVLLKPLASAPAPVAKTLPNSEPLIASIPVRTTALPPDIETRRSIAHEPAAGRKIHKRRRRGHRPRFARRTAPAPSSRSEDDAATEKNDATVPDDGAATDDAAVMPAVPVSPAVKRLVRAETREGDARMARGDYAIALRKFRTALVLDPSDDAVREKIDRAEQATEPSDEMTP